MIATARIETTPALDPGDAVTAFLRALAERGAAPNTLNAYGFDLRDLLVYIAPRTRSWPTDPLLTRALIEGYLTVLAGRGLAVATRARRLASLRSFVRYLHATGLLEVDPFRGWYPRGNPVVVGRAPRVLTRAQVDALLATETPTRYAPGSTTGTGRLERLRDAALLRLLVATGARASELVALDDDDVAAGDARLARGTAHERDVPLDDAARAALDRYRTEGRPALVHWRPDESALLVNHRGQRLSRQGLWLVVKGHAHAAGLPAWVTPGTLRTSLATRLLGDRVGTEDVAHLLGHVNVATTQLYAKLIPA